MTNEIKRRYLSITDIQKEYLPISKKKIREFVKDHLSIRLIGNRIYVERAALETLLSNVKSERIPLD